MNRMLRLYGLTSLLGVVLAAALIFFFVRKVATDHMVELAQRSNVALAQGVLGFVRQDLAEFLEQSDAGQGPGKLPAGLADAVNDLMSNPAVVRVKLYGGSGLVLFSTRFDEAGRREDSNPGFTSAMAGSVASAFDGDDNLIRSYIPVRRAPTEPIVGAFEICTDANPLIGRTERAELQMLAAVGAILALLYLALLWVVRGASRVIENQQQTIRERTATLELLSAQMLSSEEEEKRRIALELHEGLAQTLCSVKVHLEDRLERLRDERGAPADEGVIRILQSAIDDVRSLASRLRPSSLDELGLLPTLDWLCDNYERLHPQSRVERDFTLREEDTPAPLRIVLYRVVESALANIARHSASGRIDVGLGAAGEAIVLTLEHSPRDTGYLGNVLRPAERAASFAKIQEQVALSGGSFELKYNGARGVSLRASWMRVSLEEDLAPHAVGRAANG
jgi:signal transduction histidine kinase